MPQMPEGMTFPNDSFEDEIDYYGYNISLEHLLLMAKGPNAGNAAILEAKAKIRDLLQEYGDKRYDAGVDAGIGLGRFAND